MVDGEHHDLASPATTRHVRIRLHQFAAGSGETTADYTSLLAEGIELVVDRATHVDTAARTVRLASGRDFDYEFLVYAVGSTAAVPASIPGAAENAVSVVEWGSAQRLRATLVELPREAPITVAGGGLTGIAGGRRRGLAASRPHRIGRSTRCAG